MNISIERYKADRDTVKNHSFPVCAKGRRSSADKNSFHRRKSHPLKFATHTVVRTQHFNF